MKCKCWNPEAHMECDHDFDCVGYRTGDIDFNLCGKCYGCGSAQFLLAWQPTKDDLVHEPDDDRLEGVVDMWNEDKAFGFIRFNTGQRVFVHKNDTVYRIGLAVGDKVRGSVVEETDGKSRAKRVEAI